MDAAVPGVVPGVVPAPLPVVENAGTPAGGEAAWAAVITAAGSSARMGAGGKKEYRFLPGCFDGDGKPLTVLGAAAAAFAAIAEIKTLVITVPADAATGETAAREALPSRLLADMPGAPSRGGLPRLLFVPGGGTRRASVHRALSLLAAYHPRYVLIHDGARPWVTTPLIRSVMAAVIRYGAALPVAPLTETPKELIPAAELPDETAGAPGGGLPEGGALFFVKRHLPRARVGAAQTPQGFAFPEILQAHQRAADQEPARGFEYTDDAEIWGEFCGSVAAVPGPPENRKITFPEDLARRGEEAG
jgi:2-C-methyl-D-erythritol 4-phosphate cytidylyltransferase